MFGPMLRIFICRSKDSSFSSGPVFTKQDFHLQRSPNPSKAWLNWGTISEESGSRTETQQDYILLLAWKIRPNHEISSKINILKQSYLVKQKCINFFIFNIFLTLTKYIVYIFFLTLGRSASAKKMQMRSFQTAHEGKKKPPQNLPSITSRILPLILRNVFH